MAQTQAVIQTLKQALRSKGLTYAHVAEGLCMSEANVKRMFAAERLTLDRIEAICQLMSMDLSDLFQLYDDSRQRVQQLTEAQEEELVADTRLLLVAICVRNALNFEEIMQYHHLNESDLIQCLAKLDRLGLIDLLPNNKIRVRVDPNFSWLPNGPIQRFYDKAIQKEFLAGRFPPNQRLFQFGLLSKNSQAIIQSRMQALSQEFMQLNRRDRDLPWDQRHSTGMLLAERSWEFSVLVPYIK